VTLLYAVLDRRSLELSYCGAGHMPPILCRAAGETVDLPPGGIPMGLLSEFRWEEHKVQLAAGDVVFMYTDGLSEAVMRKTEDLFGEARIKAYLEANRGKSPDELNRGIVSEAQEFSRSEHLADDITLLTLKIG